MDLDEHGFFFPNYPLDQMPDLWNFNGNFDDNFLPNFSSSSSSISSSPIENELNNYIFNEVSLFPFGDEFTALPFSDEFPAPQVADTPPFSVPEDFQAAVFAGDGDLSLVGDCRDEGVGSPVFNGGICPERKIRGKKMKGQQPSKNLMAERRRRKRLNDRLSMLRSIVPNITKMDRTSIVADTIDYVKELIEKINNLKQQLQVNSNDDLNILKDPKSTEFIVRESPKFEVKRRNEENTEIEIYCSTKPGLLVSTVATLEAMGLDIQNCVISCFSDFALQASCSEELEIRKLQSCDDIKQALFRSAGFGGRCF